MPPVYSCFFRRARMASMSAWVIGFAGDGTTLARASVLTSASTAGSALTNTPAGSWNCRGVSTSGLSGGTPSLELPRCFDERLVRRDALGVSFGRRDHQPVPGTVLGA